MATTGTSAMAMVSTTVRNCRAESITGDLSGIVGAVSAASGTFNGGGQGLTLVHFSAQPEPLLVIDPAHRHRISHKTCLR